MMCSWLLLAALSLAPCITATCPDSRSLVCDGLRQLNPAGSDKNVRGHFARPCWHAFPAGRLPQSPFLSKAASMIMSESADRMLLCASKAFVASTSAAPVAKAVLDLKNKPSLKFPAIKRRALEAGLKVGYAAAFGMAVGTLPVCNELRGKKDSLPDAMSGACTGAAAGWAFYAGKPVSLIAQGTLGGAMLGFAIANQIRRNPGLFGLCECRIPSPKASIGTDDSSLEDEGEAEVLNRKVKYLNREIDNLKWTIRYSFGVPVAVLTMSIATEIVSRVLAAKEDRKDLFHSAPSEHGSEAWP